MLFAHICADQKRREKFFIFSAATH